MRYANHAFVVSDITSSVFDCKPNDKVTGGSWLYYSIVTITTLGFGDYTPTPRLLSMF